MSFSQRVIIVAAFWASPSPAPSAVDQPRAAAAESATDPMSYTGAGSCTHPLFIFPYDAGDGPWSVAIGDLDGVNGPDLVVAIVGTDDVAVLLNQGDGTFAAAVPYDTGGGPWSVAIGDLDGVTGLDLAVANAHTDDVTVLLNQGDGTFAAAVAYGAGLTPTSVAIGELDGINGPDLAVANVHSDDVWVLLNQGDGTFAPAVPYDAGNAPFSVAIGDVDGANGPDLAVANYFDDDVWVLLNQGDGTFAAAVQYDAGNGPLFVAVGDLDGLNGPDLAVANYVSHGSDDVSVLLNQGDGTFAAAVQYDAGNGSLSVAVGDLDGLNGPDLAVANAFSDDVSVLLNQGDGTFADPVPYDAGNGPRSVAIGDLDGVSGPDLAVANAGEYDFGCRCYLSDDVAVLLSLCAGPECFEVLDEQITCHVDGTTFTYQVQVIACTGAEVTFVFTASGAAPGATICFSLPISGAERFCCNSERCVTVPDCEQVVAESCDLDGDGVVGTADLLGLLAQWGTDPGGPPDLDGDGAVGVADLLALLEHWGPVP